ncbi:MAG: GntR family transcriptional regulator [Thermoflexales bacterium]|nr:GntR family transcriptional regulator [Thermoflexales bacterium]
MDSSDKTPLYQQIAEAVRQEILYGHLKPGDPLPTVRETAIQWDCTPGTVQRAYKELARQGLAVSHTGQGTRVASTLSARQESPLRQARLVHQAEAFLLQVLTAGYAPEEVEQAVRLALDRWRAMDKQPHPPPQQLVRFVGSHDPALAFIAARFADIVPNHSLDLKFAGSLGGLIALAEGQADVAGSHLWDEDSDTYNTPFVQRLLPGRRVALLTLARRRLGLIVPPGNPAKVCGIEDLARPGLRFANRQRGAGTRVWLDAQLRRRRMAPAQITGYPKEMLTHSEVACAIAEERADVGLGIESAAISYGLDFYPLTMERYDLVIPAEVWSWPAVQALAGWLSRQAAKTAIEKLGGYDTHKTGCVEWVG